MDDEFKDFGEEALGEDALFGADPDDELAEDEENPLKMGFHEEGEPEEDPLMMGFSEIDPEEPDTI